MKELFFLRHGKSDWNAGADSDHERPLAPRGKKAAARMGALVADLRRTPDLALTSTALRAKDTIRRAAEAGDWSCPVEEVRDLYGASPDEVLDLIRAQDDAHRRLLLAGHEPTFSTTVSRLIGGGRVKHVTACLAEIHVPVDRWARIAWGGGTLIWFQPPKRLG